MVFSQMASRKVGGVAAMATTAGSCGTDDMG